MLTRRRQHHSAAPWTTKQPFLGRALLAPHGEGPRKGGLTKVRLHLPSWLTAINGHLSLRSKNNENKKVLITYKDEKILKVACLNVRTMLDRADSCRPERRSALIAHELSRLNIYIAALSEVRFSGEDSLQEHGAGYTLYWSGKPETERRLSGVGFMVRNSIASKLENQPTGHSGRIISMRLLLWNQQYATLFSVYSPTLKAEPAEKDRFYSDLRSLIQSTPADDKVIILGDFNARVGQDSEAWNGVLGKHGVGNCNENGCFLLEFCAEKQFTITNTIFQQKNNLDAPAIPKLALH